MTNELDELKSIHAHLGTISFILFLILIKLFSL